MSETTPPPYVQQNPPPVFDENGAVIVDTAMPEFTRQSYANDRRAAYLVAWPVERQLEAITEHIVGRPDLLEQMMADFQVIKDRLPKPSR